MTTAHTATPWVIAEVQGDNIRTPKIQLIRPANDRNYEEGAICYVYGSEGEKPKANAAFIVRACNAHDDLVKALEYFYDAARHDKNVDPFAFKLAYAALAKAKGGA